MVNWPRGFSSRRSYLNAWMNHFCTCRIFSVSLHVLLRFLVNATAWRDCRNNRFIIYKRELQNAFHFYSAEDDSPLSHSAPPLHPQRIMAPHAQPKVTVRKQYKLWTRNTKMFMPPVNVSICRTWVASFSSWLSLVTSDCSSLITFILPLSFTVGEFTMFLAWVAKRKVFRVSM